MFHGDAWLLRSSRVQVYDHVIRVPFVVSGPDIAPRSELALITSFADVAPTLLDLAGCRAESRATRAPECAAAC